jgi:hypothetical protein
MERSADSKQVLADVPLPLALATASVASPAGAVFYTWLANGAQASDLGDMPVVVFFGYIIGMPTALGTSLLLAWPLVAWMRRRHVVACTSITALSAMLGSIAVNVPGLTFLEGAHGHFHPLQEAPIGAVAGLFAGLLLCAILRPPLRVPQARKH